jgi:hypothetical protein
MKRQAEAVLSAPRKRKVQLTSQGYKSKPCEFYIKGRCSKGEECTYSHAVAQGTNQLCRFYLTGNCLKEDCKFNHDRGRYPCRYYFSQGFCKNGSCAFSHGEVEPAMLEAFLESE